MSQYKVLVVGMGKRGMHHPTAYISNRCFTPAHQWQTKLGFRGKPANLAL